MEEAVQCLDAPPVCNQVEFHPYLDKSKLLAAASRLGSRCLPIVRWQKDRFSVIR